MGHRERLALAAILLLAALLRLSGLTFGLDLSDPRETVLNNLLDERGMVDEVQGRFLRGDLHPGSFLLRGPAGFVVFGLCDAAVLWLERLQGSLDWGARLAELDRNPSLLHLVHRLVSVVAGVLSVWLCARVTRREFGPAAGLSAAVLLACAYLHVRESHFGQVDVLWGFFTLLALERCFLLLRAPRAGRYALAGLCAGLAASAKYFSALFGATILIAHLMARAAARRTGAPVPPHRNLALAWALMPVGFLLLFPGVLMAGGDLLERLLFSRQVYGGSLRPGVLLEGLLFHGRYSLGVGLGEPVLVLVAAGALLAWRRGSTGRFFVLAALVFVPSILVTEHRPVRFALGLLVHLVPGAGIALSALLARLPRGLAALALLLVLAPSLARSSALDLLLPRRDTRVEMLALLRERALPPEEVLGAGWHHGLPVPASRTALPYTTYLPAGRDQRVDKAAVMAEIRAHPPALIVRDYSAPEGWLPADLDRLLRERYREVARLDGRRPGRDVPLPDPQHGNPTHMVPYVAPWAMSRPGPPLALFERIDP
jgi:hypothetical protein